MKKLFRIKLVLALLAGLLVAEIGPAAQPAQAADGTCATNGTVTEGDSGNYHWVKFTVTTNSSGDATCTFRTPVGVSIVSVLSVSGGGGGGHDGGGGGGGGGVLYYDQMQLNENTDYEVIVGAGGAAAGSSCTSGNCPEGIDGNLSKFNNNYAAGGGGGGGRYSAGNSAGTGGGAGHTNDATVLSGGTGSGYSDGFSVTYGRNGGNNASTRGGGGAGAVAAGNNGGDLDAGVGGKGFTSSIDGTSRVYGGGGGGGTYTGNDRSIVNVGGGGIGGNNTNNGANGSDGFGGGGGGGGDSDNPAGRGGSGVVIVRYLTVDTCATPTPVTDGSEVYLKFVTTSESRSCLKSWTVPTGVSSVQLLVIGGGGSGGTRRGTLGGGGGGGAGGFRSESSFSVTPGNSISILVGGGGAAQTAQQDAWGFDGNLSYFSTVIAQGGGGGGAYCGGADDQTDTRSNAVTISINGRAGGSGGGGGRCSSSTGGAAANASYGNAGGSANATAVAGGGGGKGSAGNSGGAASNPGRGGNGATSTITGSTLTYAAGGGGSGGVAALGGSSIGGTGAREGVSAATAGSSQTGSGGGGGYASSGAGGSGVVIVRYQPSTCSPTSTNSNGFEYVSFTTVTTCNWQIPTGVSSIDLVVVGGGGGGGYDSGGGGGGGGYAEKIGLSVTSGATFILTVGSGGAAATSSQSVGTTGSSSIFSSISATGGTGGGSCTYTGQGFNGSSCESRNIGGNRGTGTNGTTNSTSTKVGGNGFCFSNSGSGCSSAVSTSASGWTSSVNSQTYSIGGGGGGSADVNPTANTGSGGKGGGGNSTGSAGASGFIVVKYRSGPLNVTFDSQGGSAVASTTVLTGETLPAPTAPTRAGYNFFGWATASYGTPITFPYTHNQSANFTLYAQWGAKSLTIVYDTQGGSSIPNGSVLVGSFINPAPATPTRDGYTFNGWFVAPTGGTAISNFSTYAHNQTSNFTLYAQWSVTAPNLSSVTVSGTALSGSIITATPSATGLGPITFNYQWYRILTGIGTYLIDGATSSTYTLTDSDLLGYTYVNVTASNEGGSSSSVIGSMPANQKIGVATPTISGTLQSGQLLTGSTTSTVPAGATSEYRWLSSDTAGGTYTEIDKATNSTYRLTSSDIGKYIKFRIIIRNNNLGVTSIASSSSATNVVSVSEPTISSQPTSATKYAGQSATFSVTASASDSGSLSYQWKKNTIDIKDATSSSYVINSVTSGDAGSYTVVVTNTLNGTTATATSNAAVLTFATATQLSTPNTPGTTTITGSTTSIGVTYTAVTNATSHTVKVYASGVLVGTARTSFVSGTTITGLTAGTTYTVTVTALGDGTFYTDSAESAASTVTTNAAAVIPTINSQPTSATRYAGQSVDFTVVASAPDSGSLSYQWKKNGTVISGAQSATFSINPISSSDAGNYTVDITNTKNGTTASITSNTATLTFATATQLSTPTAPTVSATSGSTTSITVSFTSVANASSHTVKVYASNVLVGTAHTSFSSGSTITGLSPNTAYTVTVTAIGDGTIYSDSAASTSASVTTNEFLGSALTPEIDGVESTLDGFRMSLKNYDSNFNFTFSLTNGALASINSSGIISVTNLAPGESSTITITTSRTNYPSASVSTSGTAISIKTVTFNANGGLGTMTAQTGRTSGTLSANTFTRQYYDFLRWNTESNGTGNDYEDLATYSFIGDLTLYALWSPIPLTVTYNSQGGTPVSNGATTYLGKISSAPTPPTRSGYTFLGWSATPAGSVVLFEYTHNQNSNFTLYAIWRLNVAVPTISSQPVSANKYSGQSVTFSVTASVSDSGVLSYQWKKNGTNISGATASSYAINSVSSSDAGDYTVVITNTNNGETSSITSDVAKLNFVASTQLATPSAPTVTATSGSTTSITISFTAISNASSYTARIYQGGSQVGAARTSFTSGSTITGLTAGTTYTVTITAIGDGSIYSDSAASSAATVTTNSPATNTNTITFATISDKTYGDSFSVTVSASSGLTVTVSSSTTSVCTVSTLTVTAISVGTCTLVAAQGGDGTYPSATSVTNTFTVGKKSLVITASDQSGTVGSSTSAPSYSQSGLVSALGDAIGSVSYTYAGSGSTRYAPSSNAPSSGGNWILGTYKITPASLVLSSGSASNYNISYVQGTLTVSGTSTTGISAISVKSTGLNRTTELLTGFSPSTTSYGIYVESAVTSVTVVITRSAGSLANAQVSVNDSGFRRLTFTSNAANSGILALPQQSNTITLKIVATDLSVQTYTISILRDQATSSATGGVPTPTPTATPRPANQVINSVAFFVNSTSGNTSSLIEVSMNRAFDKAVSSYSVSFTNAQSVTQLRTTFTDPGLTIRIKMNQGAFRTIPSSGASTSLALNVGANTAILRVASSDGTVADYTFTLNRAA